MMVNLHWIEIYSSSLSMVLMDKKMINLKYKKYYLGIYIFCCSVLNCSLSVAQLKDSARLIEAEDALKPNDEVLQSLDMEIQSLLITNSKRIAQINGKF